MQLSHVHLLICVFIYLGGREWKMDYKSYCSLKFLNAYFLKNVGDFLIDWFFVWPKPAKFDFWNIDSLDNKVQCKWSPKLRHKSKQLQFIVHWLISKYTCHVVNDKMSFFSNIRLYILRKLMCINYFCKCIIMHRGLQFYLPSGIIIRDNNVCFYFLIIC